MTTASEKRLTRRQFLAATAAGAAGMGLASLDGATTRVQASADRPKPTKPNGVGPYNIVFILTD